MKTRFLLFILLSGHLVMGQVNKSKNLTDTTRRIQDVEGIVVNGLRAKDAPNNTLVTKTTLNSKNFWPGHAYALGVYAFGCYY